MNIYKEESVSNRNNLIEWFEAGCKHTSNYKIGTEHEKFLYHLDTLKPIDYHGKKGIVSLFKLLKNFNNKSKKIRLKINQGYKSLDRFDYKNNCKKYFQIISKYF